MAAIGAMVEAEAADRAIRFAILTPVAPMFAAAHPDGRLVFPRVALGLIWRALKADLPERVREASEAFRYHDPEDAAPEVFDQLCAQAADALESGETPDYVAAAAACDAIRPGASADLVLALRLSPIARPVISRLADWMQRMTDERRATARLAYRDATAMGEGGGPLIFEILAAHLPQPSLVLRVISAVMDHPGERYLSDSELARFGERPLYEVEAQLARIQALQSGGGVEAGRLAGLAVQKAIEASNELEQAVQMSRDGVWGKRLTKLKQSIAAAVEMRLKDIEEASNLALPVQKIRYSARLTRTAPKLTDLPDPAAVDWAMGLLTFAEVVRPAAAEGGFGSVRTRVLENLGKRIDQYVEDVLEQMRLGELDADARAGEFLAIAADLLSLARDEKSAGVVRRRAAAAQAAAA